MNDTERELRELFESKARQAGAAPRVTREVLRRGRRRQLGTVAVAGITALAVTGAAVVSLQALTRSDTTSVPGGDQGNPAFTATIQNFTLTVPQGWTLIDQWPIAMAIPVETSSSQHFSCVGEPITAGGPNAGRASAGDGCPEGTQNVTPAPEPQTIPRGGLPMLTLSNTDPGLTDTVCDADHALPATAAALYIGLDYGVTRVAGWEDRYPVDRGALTNVLDGDLPIDQMPCGPGGYSRFQAGGLPWFAWAGFGSDVTDADRQAVIDAFGAMSVSGAELSSTSDDTPGYVIAGATDGDAQGWTLEVSPTDVNVDLRYRERSDGVSGAADFGVPDVPIELSDGHQVVFGAVTFDAERVELRPSDGSAPIAGTILELPESLGAPFNAFVVPGNVPGEVVAVGLDGDLGSARVGGATGQPSLQDRQVQSDLRNAYVAAKTYFTDANTYEGFGPEEALAIEPSMAYNTDATAVAGEVSIRDVGADHIVLVEATESGNVFCIAENIAGLTTYGATDAQRALDCDGGEAAWGLSVPTETPTAVPIPSEPSVVDVQGFPSLASLTVQRDEDNGCLSIEIATGDQEGAGFCTSEPLQPVAAEMVTISESESAVLGYVAPGADQVFLISDDGRRFDAPVLYTLEVEPSVQFFAIGVPVTSGRLHIEDVNGVVLVQPIPLDSAP